jgi:hypothetical protein
MPGSKRSKRSKKGRRDVAGGFQILFLFLAFAVAVLAVPIGAINHREYGQVQELSRTGSWHDVLTIRKLVERSKSSYIVDKVEATYEDDSGIRTVRIRGSSSADSPQWREGWVTTYDRGTEPPTDSASDGDHDYRNVDKQVRVSRDGKIAFLWNDYHDHLNNVDADANQAFTGWIGFWSLAWFVTSLARRRRQLAVGLALGTVRNFALRLALGYGLVMGLLWLVSFPLEML